MNTENITPEIQKIFLALQCGEFETLLSASYDNLREFGPALAQSLCNLSGKCDQETLERKLYQHVQPIIEVAIARQYLQLDLRTIVTDLLRTRALITKQGSVIENNAQLALEFDTISLEKKMRLLLAELVRIQAQVLL